MVDIQAQSDLVKRRFDEVFLLSTKDLRDENDLNYFFQRIADFYEYTKQNFPDFINFTDSRTELADELIVEERKITDDFFLEISSAIQEFSKIKEFNSILEEGKREFEKHINGGVYSPTMSEVVYQSYDWRLKPLLNYQAADKYSIDEARDILLSFNRVNFELREFWKGEWIPDFKKFEDKATEIVKHLELAQKKVNRYFEYERISSYRTVKQIWEHFYSEIGFSVISLQISIAKDNIKSFSAGQAAQAHKQCDEFRVEVVRFNNSLLDWLGEQNYIEESFNDFRIWVEILDNETFKNKFTVNKSGNETRNEKLLKDEFAKFIFISHKIFTFKEPSIDPKRPDSLMLKRDKKIISEAKILSDEFSKNEAVRVIEQGLKQLKSYSKIFPYVDAGVLILFNYSQKVELSEDIIRHKFTQKPFFILPINVNARPSDRRSVLLTKLDLEKSLNNLGLS